MVFHCSGVRVGCGSECGSAHYTQIGDAMGLKMNIAKTKVMVVDNTPINVNNVLIENVPGYVYL